MQPRILHKKQMVLAGIRGDGADAAGLWRKYEQLRGDALLTDRVGEDHFELRLSDDEGCACLVGALVSGEDELPAGFTRVVLPPSVYACFDVRVAEGYDSQNAAMERWLEHNPEGYREGTLDGRGCTVELYGERFCGCAPESIVDIWIAVYR